MSEETKRNSSQWQQCFWFSGTDVPAFLGFIAFTSQDVRSHDSTVPKNLEKNARQLNKLTKQLSARTYSNFTHEKIEEHRNRKPLPISHKPLAKGTQTIHLPSSSNFSGLTARVFPDCQLLVRELNFALNLSQVIKFRILLFNRPSGLTSASYISTSTFDNRTSVTI